MALTSRDGSAMPRESRPARMRLSELRAIVDRILPMLPSAPDRALTGAPYSQ